ncbi:MAG: sugar ABC transporter permease [Candidatus Hydrogenedentes bacterium]|nr:sugar ABC transporter permease [Candidatus Hydrogenedentota bacterium]
MSARTYARRFSGYLFLLPYLTLFAGFLLVPFVYGLGLSFFRWEMISPAPPKCVGFGNYAEALGSAYFWKALGATFRFVVMSVPLNIGMALIAAVGINAVAARRQALYRAAYFLPLIISISVAGILWRWFYNGEFGLFNALLAPLGLKAPWVSDVRWAMKSLVLMTLWWTAGGPMVILLAGLQHIPRHYYEAAAIDGAGRTRQFLHITLPQLRPVLLFVLVMNVIGGFQVFGQAFLITRGGPEFSTRVLVQYIYETAFTHYRMGYGSAMSWLLFLVIAAFSAAQFRILRER